MRSTRFPRVFGGKFVFVSKKVRFLSSSSANISLCCLQYAVAKAEHTKNDKGQVWLLYLDRLRGRTPTNYSSCPPTTPTVLIKITIHRFCLNQGPSTPANLMMSWELREYGYRVCSKQEPPSCFKGWKWGSLVFDQKRLEPREFTDNDTMGFISSFSIFGLVSEGCNGCLRQQQYRVPHCTSVPKRLALSNLFRFVPDQILGWQI